MNLKENTEIRQIIERLEEGMVDYMSDADYGQRDVQKCIKLILNHLDQVENSSSKDEGLQIVKRTVVSLNELNERLDFELIETEERENIAEIIIIAGSLKGYNSRDEDVTEEWREW